MSCLLLQLFLDRVFIALIGVLNGQKDRLYTVIIFSKIGTVVESYRRNVQLTHDAFIRDSYLTQNQRSLFSVTDRLVGQLKALFQLCLTFTLVPNVTSSLQVLIIKFRSSTMHLMWFESQFPTRADVSKYQRSNQIVKQTLFIKLRWVWSPQTA